MNTVIDILFLRRPKIDYLSPGICEATFSSTGFPIIVLPEFHRLLGPTGLVITGGFGHRRLSWNAYPNALCYNIYRADCDPGVPPETLSYSLIAECVADTFFDLPDEGCYRVSAVTALGESDLSDPICTCETPTPPPFETPVLSRDDGVILSWTITGLQPQTAHLQRSEDGITWSDYASVAWNSTLHVNSDFDYRVIGFTSGEPSSNFSNTVNVPLHPTAIAWRERVIVNGGVLASKVSTRTQSDFCYHLDEYDIRDNILILNAFAADDLIACRTPLIAGRFDIWDNGNFLPADLDINGLLGDGSSKYLDTGFNAVLDGTSQNDACMFVYESTTTASIPNRCPMGASAGPNIGLTLFTNSGANTQWVCWDNSASALNVAVVGAGFTLGSRVSANENNLYFANSTTPWFLQATSAAASVGVPPTTSLFTHAFHFFLGQNSYSDRRMSGAGVAIGMTSEKGSHLYDGFQAMRIAMGGGFV